MHKSVGGLGYVDLKDYYYASLLAQLKPWFMPHSQSIRRDLEALQVPGCTLYDWLISTLQLCNKDKSLTYHTRGISPSSFQSTTKHIFVPIADPLNHHQVTDSRYQHSIMESKSHYMSIRLICIWGIKPISNTSKIIHFTFY